MRGPVRWYVHDPSERTHAAAMLSVHQQEVVALQGLFEAINPYAASLRQLGLEASMNVTLYVQWRDESSEVAAIIHNADASANATPRTIIFWKTSKQQPTFIDTLHPLYEPLQYPLFFPHEAEGWHAYLHSVGQTHCKVSQIKYYRQCILIDARSGTW